MSVLFAAVTLPIDAARERADEAPLPRLPALERLAARADRAASDRDWRRWALARAGLTAPDGDLPLGRLLAAAAGLSVDAAATWLVATPLNLRAGLSDVRVTGVGSRLSAAAAGALAQRFNAEWERTPWRLHSSGASLLLSHAAPLELATVDPESLLGGPPSDGNARGRDAPTVMRLLSELEMWLHAAPAPLDFNALWPWGGGRGALAGQARWPELADPDPCLAAARACHPGASSDARLVRWSLALRGDDDPFGGAERDWFAPLAAELADGRWQRAELHLGRATLQLRPAHRFRLWRGSRPWWELA